MQSGDMNNESNTTANFNNMSFGGALNLKTKGSITDIRKNALKVRKGKDADPEQKPGKKYDPFIKDFFLFWNEIAVLWKIK